MSAAADKPFDATPSKRDRAKREGNVARSSEVASVASFAGALLVLCAAVPLIAASAANALRGASGASTLALGALIGFALLPACGAALTAGLAGLFQAGGFRISPLKLSLAKLNPASGLKRMFGGEAIVGGVRATLAFAIAAAAVLPVLLDATGAARAVVGTAGIAQRVWSGTLHAALSAVAVGGVFAFADYALARRRWLHGLKMSFEEMKRDSRENDGDPHAKSKRKQIHRAIARGSIAHTKQASFVVVNPTHIAIAIRYDPPQVDVPIVLVRAADAIALEVKAIALRERIPVIENVPLARLLYASSDAGSPIPAETFVAVAHVIAELARAEVFS